MEATLTQKKYYSTTKFAKTMGESRKKVNWYMFNNPEYSLVDPVEVGSGKRKILVWKLTSQTK